MSSFLVGERFWLGLVGGAFLCGLGIRTFVSKPAEKAAESRGTDWSAAYGTTLLLTLTNPMTILSFAAVFGGFGIGVAHDFGRAGALVAGVFTGSAAWWLLLSTGAGLGRSRVTPMMMRGINPISGAVIFGFGLYALGTTVSAP